MPYRASFAGSGRNKLITKARLMQQLRQELPALLPAGWPLPGNKVLIASEVALVITLPQGPAARAG